jgi:hypothetical protein
MSTQYRLVQSGKTASGGCSAGQRSSEPVAPRIYYYYYLFHFFSDVSCKSVARTVNERKLKAQSGTYVMTPTACIVYSVIYYETGVVYDQ